MNIREMAEQREADYLSIYASLSRESRGREREEPPCDIRPVYQRDRDRILHSKALPDETHAYTGGSADSPDDHQGTAAQ